MGLELVATVIAGPHQRLSAAFVAELAKQTQSTRTQWLLENAAADIFYSTRKADLYAQIKQIIGTHPIDVIIQPTATRRKKLLVADMESTVIEQEMFDEMASVIGQRAKVAQITRSAMNGEIDFISAFRERAGLFKGVPASTLDTVARRITLMPGAATLIATMKAHGAHTRLVSGGFNCFVKPVARQLGFDESYANELIIRDGIITGEVKEPILDKIAKKKWLEKFRAELRLAPHECLAVGDGANDIPMLEACNVNGGLGVAYHAKPAVKETTPHQINHADMRGLLFVQGFEHHEFVV